jgi:hypothetical protein
MSKEEFEKRVSASVGKVSTSVVLPAELWQKAKIHALKNGLTLYQVVEEALRKYLEGVGGEEAT